MKRIWLIGLKDVKLAFRDTAALIMMLAAPFLLTLGLGFATGSFGSGSSGLDNISFIIVDQDKGELADALVQLFQSEELSELVEPEMWEDEAAARKLVDDDATTAVVIIPVGFTASIIPEQGSQAAGEVVKLEIYSNPNRPTSAGVIETIVEGFLAQVETGRVGAEVTLRQLLENGLIAAQDVEALGRMIGESQAVESAQDPVLSLQTRQVGQEAQTFNALAIMAPGMALMFLMYTVSYGGRSILVERNLGTLPRLLVSPTSTAEVLGGKVLGIFLTGAAQMFILIVGCALLFQLDWGDPVGVAVLVLAAVFGATGWGMLLTALARTPGQIANIGSALMLTFGILGGNFVNLEYLPEPVQWLSKITPNAWGMDGFTTLALGGRLPQLVAPVAALLVMGTVLFVAAVLLFNRNAVVK
jgi:ABC-2 type transport system permease protein